MLTKLYNIWHKCSWENYNAYLRLCFEKSVDAGYQPRCCCCGSRRLFFCVNMGVFSKKDRIVISELFILKGYGAKRVSKQRLEWKVRSLNKLLRKLRETGTTDRRIGSGTWNSGPACSGKHPDSLVQICGLQQSRSEPADCKVWGLLQEHVYKSPVKDMSELKQRLVEAWSAMPQRVIDEAIDEWRRRLRCCVSVVYGSNGLNDNS